MSQQEYLMLRAKLNQGLKDSYEKMLQLKIKLGEDIVISDAKGNPVVITAKEAWERLQKKNTHQNDC